MVKSVDSARFPPPPFSPHLVCPAYTLAGTYRRPQHPCGGPEAFRVCPLLLSPVSRQAVPVMPLMGWAGRPLPTYRSSLTGCCSPPLLVNSGRSISVTTSLEEGLCVPLHSRGLIRICGCASWVCSRQCSAPHCGRVKDVTGFPSLYS